MCTIRWKRSSTHLITFHLIIIIPVATVGFFLVMLLDRCIGDTLLTYPDDFLEYLFIVSAFLGFWFFLLPLNKYFAFYPVFHSPISRDTNTSPNTFDLFYMIPISHKTMIKKIYKISYSLILYEFVLLLSGSILLTGRDWYVDGMCCFLSMFFMVFAFLLFVSLSSERFYN